MQNLYLNLQFDIFAFQIELCVSKTRFLLLNFGYFYANFLIASRDFSFLVILKPYLSFY